jgi:indole-3-glycerol phosphate synthase
MSILKEIYDYKLNFVSKQKKILPQKEIEKEIKIDDNNKNSFYKKLKIENNKISIIGEIKKASPSLGIFVNDTIDIIKIAKTYEENNISCLSVLTDEKYFHGSINDFKQIREEIKIPILRKEFIVDEYQIYESKLIGADCILIILSMLSPSDADKFNNIAHELGLDVIIEVHDSYEFNIADNINSKIIGINNRNLNNFRTDLKTTIKLATEFKNSEKILISESGFQHKKDIQKIRDNTDINNFLIGEYLMKSKDLPSHIRELLN